MSLQNNFSSVFGTIRKKKKYILSHVRKWATPSSGPLHNFLLNGGTHVQGTMFQVCLYGRGISAEELDQRCVISISKNVPNHQIDLKMAVSLFSLLCTF